MGGVAMSIPAADRKWMAESDANTLAEAEAIKVDKVRLGRAKTAAVRLAKQKQAEAAGMKKVAKKAVGKKDPAKRTSATRADPKKNAFGL